MVLPDTAVATFPATILFPAALAVPRGLCLGATEVEELPTRGTLIAILFEPLCTGNCWVGFAAKPENVYMIFSGQIKS